MFHWSSRGAGSGTLTPKRPSRVVHGPAELGHFDQFPPISPRVGCRFGQGTFAGAARKEQDAPIPAIRATTVEISRRSGSASSLVTVDAYLSELMTKMARGKAFAFLLANSARSPGHSPISSLGSWCRRRRWGIAGWSRALHNVPAIP